MRCFLAGLMFLAVTAPGQTPPPQPNPAAIFEHARARLMADAQRMPRYTCEQNIVRHFYRAESGESQSCAQILARRVKRKHDPPPTSWDRLQLDVAVADDREIHSWPGAPKFNEDEIRRLVSNGPFGSGDFSAFVTGIFGGSANIKYAGQRAMEGRTFFEYSFAVTGKASHYQIATNAGNLVTAYDGTFLLDPENGDLFQLAVRTAELPEATKACQAGSEIAYRRQDIHGHQVLIPKETDLRIVYRDGREAVASTSYSSCHEYTSKSILHFDAGNVNVPETVSRSSVANKPAANPLPAGLNFNCRIVTPIDSDSPAGRPIEAVLRSPLRNKSKVVLAPQGAHIHGRLVRLADHKSSLDYFEVGIRLESIEVNGTELPLYASLSSPGAPPVNPFEGGGSSDRNEQLADFPTAPPRNVGIFFFVRERLRLPQFDSEWITTSAESEKQGAPPSAAQKQAELEKQNLEREVNNLVSAIKDAQKAIELENAGPRSNSGALCDIPNLTDVLAFRRKATEEGEAADKDSLNKIYPELGDRFRSEFIESQSSFVRGCEMSSQLAGLAGQYVPQSRSLANDWANWYDVHRKAIQDSINQRQLASEWLSASSSPFETQRVLPQASPTQPAMQKPAAEVIQDAPVQDAQVKDEQVKDAQVQNPQTRETANAAPPNPAIAASAPVSPPPGAAIPAELSKSVDAKKSKVGDTVEARITLESILPGQVVLPRNTKIIGHVSKVKAHSKDSPGSMVEITFDHALVKDNQQLPLQITLQAIGKPIPVAPAAVDASLTQGGAAPAAAASSGNSRNTADEAPREAPPSANPDAATNMPGEDASRSTLNAKSQGAIGFDGLALSASAQASTISSAKGNVHLEKGTQLILRTL